MYAICMKNTILYYKAKNALYKRHGWNYEKILLYQYVIFNCEIITEKYAEINKNNLQNKKPKSKTKCCYLRKRNC